MARHRADQPEDQLDSADDGREEFDEALDAEDSEDAGDSDDSADEGGDERPADVVKFWDEMKISPVEIALPRGVGYTLRAYRMSDTLATDEPEATDLDADEVDEVDEVDVEEAPRASAARSSSRRGRVEEKVDEDEEELDDEDLDEDDLEDEDLEDDELDEDEDDEEEEDEEDEEEEEPEPEEVPVFLTQDRKLLLFRSPEGLAEFVRSGEANSLDALDEWLTLSAELTAEQVQVSDDDRYELDLVVENLRGGHDAWDAELLIKAGELCRDLGHALRIDSVMSALGSGSPLDDLDEALRSTENGRVTAFFARRKLRRIRAQQAALAWRSIIGKISTSVDWRD